MAECASASPTVTEPRVTEQLAPAAATPLSSVTATVQDPVAGGAAGPPTPPGILALDPVFAGGTRDAF